MREIFMSILGCLFLLFFERSWWDGIHYGMANYCWKEI